MTLDSVTTIEVEPRPEDYLRHAQWAGVVPNFWMTAEYIEKAGFKVRAFYAGKLYNNARHIGVFDGDELVFPAIGLNGRVCSDVPSSGIWADFEQFRPDASINRAEFLDYQYLYDPRAFLDLSGGDRATFRKNVRKFEARCEPLVEIWRPPIELSLALLVDWLEAAPERWVYDAEVMRAFVCSGWYRVGYCGRESGRLYALNIWDYGASFIHYRYCICAPGFDFLSEVVRLRFYTSMANSGMLINDGGALGLASLERFKDKLLPVSKTRIYSWYNC